jgi:Flp pilus assembly pilin Flp
MKQATASRLLTNYHLSACLHSAVEYCRSLWREEDGQDLVEYSLLLGFIAVGSMAALGGAQTSITSLWNAINKNLSTAATAAS